MKTVTIISSLVIALSATFASAETSVDSLLEAIESGRILGQKENREREARFLEKKSERAALLSEGQQEQVRLENKSNELETLFEQNEVAIDDTKDVLDKRLGSLKELFGVVQGASGDFSSALNFSLTNIEFEGRQDFLQSLNAKMADSTELPEISELEKLWFEMSRELNALGDIKVVSTSVSDPAGVQTERDVLRVGAFNLVSEGKYLQYIPETGSVVELARQPKSSFQNQAAALQSSSAEVLPFAIDPTGATGGSLLGALIDTPTLMERVQQGKQVGIAILIIGAIGLLLSVERFITLFFLRSKINWQLKNVDSPADKNPLGRILLTYKDNLKEDLEALELKIHEAVINEIPKLMRNLGFIKIISMVAPLMGLLGTVTGMIMTFQAITLFGTGDPKTMAGGISSALITTVLGLVVAIPTLLLHSLLNSQARGLVTVLEQQSAGLIAEHAEKRVSEN